MMKEIKYDIVIFDVDETLLDYSQSQTNAFYLMMAEIGMECNDDLSRMFEVICNEEWDKMNLDNTLDEIVQKNYHALYYEYGINRCERVRELMNIDIDANKLSEIYLEKFSNECRQIDNAQMVCRTLSLSSKLAIATNGLSKVQRSRLSSFEDVFCKLFISEETNHIKPSKEFFNEIIEELAIADLSRVLMVGDSLISDIYGANRVGMDTCWFNPKGKENKSGINPTFEIRNLNELLTNRRCV